MTKWLGRAFAAAGLASWSWWLAWRVGTPVLGPLSVVELVLELLAFAAAVVVTSGMWSATSLPVADARGRVDARVLGEALHLPADQRTHGADDGGEVACARHGLGQLLARRAFRLGHADRTERACAVFAVEGMRRMCFVALVVVVLLTGRFPFTTPPPARVVAALVAGQVLIAVGHWLLSGRRLSFGERTRWSMRSVGAGIGDGRSRTGLPIRWATTLGTVIVVNLAVALRGFSDRWTHGLGALDHDERVLTMAAAWWIVAVGVAALRQLPRPALVSDQRAGRVEEQSSRRLALGGTLLVAVVGCAAALLPGTVPA